MPGRSVRVLRTRSVEEVEDLRSSCAVRRRNSESGSRHREFGGFHACRADCFGVAIPRPSHEIVKVG